MKIPHSGAASSSFHVKSKDTSGSNLFGNEVRNSSVGRLLLWGLGEIIVDALCFFYESVFNMLALACCVRVRVHIVFRARARTRAQSSSEPVILKVCKKAHPHTEHCMGKSHVWFVVTPTLPMVVCMSELCSIISLCECECVSPSSLLSSLPVHTNFHSIQTLGIG